MKIKNKILATFDFRARVRDCGWRLFHASARLPRDYRAGASDFRGQTRATMESDYDLRHARAIEKVSKKARSKIERVSLSSGRGGRPSGGVAGIRRAGRASGHFERAPGVFVQWITQTHKNGV